MLLNLRPRSEFNPYNLEASFQSTLIHAFITNSIQTNPKPTQSACPSKVNPNEFEDSPSKTFHSFESACQFVRLFLSNQLNLCVQLEVNLNKSDTYPKQLFKLAQSTGPFKISELNRI